MAFEDILKEIGQFGTYQKRIYILLCYPALFLSGLMVVNVFLLGIPEHRLVHSLILHVSYEILVRNDTRLLSNSLGLVLVASQTSISFFVPVRDRSIPVHFFSNILYLAYRNA